MQRLDRRVAPLGGFPADTGSPRGDVIAVLRAVNRRCHAAQAVPDPGGKLAAYLRRRATAEGFEQMDLVLRRARQRGEAGASGMGPQVARLPVRHGTAAATMSCSCSSSRPACGYRSQRITQLRL